MPELPELIAPGDVWLVGAGPGDPDLLTRKAEKLIQMADIVFYDALVGAGVLALIPDGVERISVGKRSGRHSKDQGSINALLLAAACAGKRVVRLKGGDPSIFGRSAEEIETLASHGIQVRVCPGITAASAAAASANLSLTLRGLARKLIFITAHTRTGQPIDIDWQSLADPEATLAIYMGKSVARETATALMHGGMAGDTPVLLAENVSLADERLIHTRLDRLGPTADMVMGSGPVLLLIGRAVKVGTGAGDEMQRAKATGSPNLPQCRV